MDTGSGRLADATGLSPSVEPLRVSPADAASIPSADDWIVVRESAFGSYYRFEYAQVDTVKAKTMMVKRGAGRRLQRVSLDSFLPARDLDHAKLLVQHLESAKAESMRRERAAQDWYHSTVAKIAASAMSALQGQDAERLGATPASAVPQGDAPEMSA